MQDNNKPTEYSLSPADTPKDKRGTPACDLRIDPTAAPKPQPAPPRDYGSGKSDPHPNLMHAHTPPSVLRDMLREAEQEHEYKHRYRKKKLFVKLFWIFFAIYAVGITLIMLAGMESLSLGDTVLLVLSSVIVCVPSAAVTAFVYRWIIIAGYTSVFSNEAAELQYIEHLKDCMCQSSERGQA